MLKPFNMTSNIEAIPTNVIITDSVNAKTESIH